MRLAIRLVFLLSAIFFILLKNNIEKAPATTQAEEPPLQSDISFFDGNYQDLFNGYSLKQPGENWRFSPTPRSNNLIKLDITHKSGKYGLQVRVHKKGSQSFEEFVRSYIDQFLSDMQNPDILEQKEFAAAGVIGTAVSFDGRKRNGYFLKSYVFPGNRFYYALQGGCPFDQKAQLESELDQIAATFSKL